MKASKGLGIGVVTTFVVSAGNASGGITLGLESWQYHPSAGTAIYLDAGEWELTPTLNPTGGYSAFFSGGGWNSWQWNVAVWNSNDDSTHNSTDANRIAWFRTNNYGNPNGFDPNGAMLAFNAAVAGDRMTGTTGAPGDGPYRFTVATSGTYYFGIWDSDLTNNVGSVFADLHAVPAPGAAPLIACAVLSRGRRRR
jgi:hypothetical protein